MNAVVLLSGGFDSTAALAWASARYDTAHLRAVCFDYGQPNRDQELTRAGEAAREYGITLARLALADTMLPSAGILHEVPAHVPDAQGQLHRAFIPGRNILFATLAASHACGWFRAGVIGVVLGCNKDDVAGFPDCRPNTLAALGDTLHRGLGRDVRILTPWNDRTKAQILYSISPDPRALAVVSKSWSCYAAQGPCGECTPCVLRAEAFKSQNLPDLSAMYHLRGGDPQRDLSHGSSRR